MKALAQWRNALAHGHCVDRPTQALRHNHFISPDQYPGIINHLSELRRLLFGYVRISRYLDSIGNNEYGAGPPYEVERAK